MSIEKPEEEVQAVIATALALLRAGEEVEAEDVTMMRAPIELWQELEDAIEKVGPAEVTNYAGAILANVGDAPAGWRRWQPIATAPKNGTQMWLFDRSEEPTQLVGAWDAAYGGWAYAEALVQDVVGEARPTHWMPLPEPANAGGNPRERSAAK